MIGFLFEGIMGFSGLIGTLLSLAVTAFWIWMIADCATNEENAGTSKTIWLIVIVLTQIIGALIYYIVRRPQRMQELGR